MTAKSGGQKPLNECLYSLPSWTAELFDVLLTFRVFNVAVVGDIEKTFFQTSLNSDDRDYVCLLIFRILKVTRLCIIGFVVYCLGLHHHHFCCPPLSYSISPSFII